MKPCRTLRPRPLAILVLTASALVAHLCPGLPAALATPGEGIGISIA